MSSESFGVYRLQTVGLHDTSSNSTKILKFSERSFHTRRVISHYNLQEFNTADKVKGPVNKSTNDYLIANVAFTVYMPSFKLYLYFLFQFPRSHQCSSTSVASRVIVCVFTGYTMSLLELDYWVDLQSVYMNKTLVSLNRTVPLFSKNFLHLLAIKKKQNSHLSYLACIQESLTTCLCLPSRKLQLRRGLEEEPHSPQSGEVHTVLSVDAVY